MDLQISEKTKFIVIISTILMSLICICCIIGISYYYPSSNLGGICICMLIFIFIIILTIFGQAYYPIPYYSPVYYPPPPPLIGFNLGSLGNFGNR